MRNGMAKGNWQHWWKYRKRENQRPLRFVSLFCSFFLHLFSRFVQVCLVRPDGKDREIIGAFSKSHSTSWSNRFMKFIEDWSVADWQSSCTGEMHAFAQEHVHLWAYSALLLVQKSVRTNLATSICSIKHFNRNNGRMETEKTFSRSETNHLNLPTLLQGNTDLQALEKMI